MAREGWPPMSHVWTQAVIGLCLVLMIIVLTDLSRKFQTNAQPPNRNKRVQTYSRTSEANSTSSKSRTVSKPSTSKPKKKPISKFYQITTITSITAFTAAVLIDFGDGVYYFDTGIDVFHTKHYWAIVLTNIFFGISTISLYIFMFGRLYLTLSHTESKYHLSKLAIYGVTILIILNAFGIIFYTVCIGMIYDYIAIGTFYKWLNVAFKLLLFFDFTLNFIMLSLFLYKLQQIILSLDYATDYNELGIVSDDEKKEEKQIINIKLNDHQNKMVTIMTRHTILSSIAILFNVLFYISNIYGSNIEMLHEADLFFLAYSNLIKALHGLSVAVTLYLNFSFNINLYFKFCNKWHLCCFNLFAKFAKNRIQKKKENEQNQQNNGDTSLQLTVQPVDSDNNT